jgi:hypothetical protein
VVTASLVASGRLGLPLYVSVLAVLGVNRFFLSSLSAALPHVVAEDKLVMANAMSPTLGTVVTFIGGLAGLGVHFATGGGRGGSALTLLAAGACYLLAAGVGATMRRDLLGPPPVTGDAARAGLLTELSTVAEGLISGARHVWRRRPVAAALAATGCHRLLYGTLLLMTLLLYRNYFYPTSANKSLAQFTLVIIASAVGYGAAAIITPMATKRLAKPTLITVLLAAGGIVAGVLGPTFSQVPFVVIGFALGVVAQGVAISQEMMADSFRGRVFSLYDMLFNVPFVVGAAGSALIMPLNGRSFPLIAFVAVGYLVAAGAYLVLGRQALGGRPPASEPPVPESPSSTAQASSS